MPGTDADAPGLDVLAAVRTRGEPRGGAAAASLFQGLMGADFARLPRAVQRFHALQDRHVLDGWVAVDASASWAARLLAWCVGAPTRAQCGPLRFELMAGHGTETWTRHFPGRSMQSSFRAVRGMLQERLGPVQLGFALAATGDGLDLQLVSLRFLGIPFPRWGLPQVVGRESDVGGRLHFKVRAGLPLLGTVASYEGQPALPGEAPQ
jgi:hypothetical protein